MLISIAVIILSGLFLGKLCKIMRFPSLFGMVIAGIIIGPYALNLIDSSILNVSAEIRRIALIVILLRAGLKLDLSDLKKVGRPAVLMCFIPACFEIIGMVILAPLLLGMSRLDAAILGAVIGAVSPAVIVPRMIKLMLGVFICVLGTDLNFKEKIFCMIAYTPKATVQAAIGGIPLAMGLSCGETVLTVSVVAILLTAPLGAFGIDLTYRKCLKGGRNSEETNGFGNEKTVASRNEPECLSGAVIGVWRP